MHTACKLLRRRLARAASRLRAGEAGSAMTEFALLAPIMIGLMFWLNYFWEVQRVRIKAAEAARYVAFERTTGRSYANIQSDVQQRFRDLNSTTPTGNMQPGLRNQLFIDRVSGVDVDAPLSSHRLSDATSGAQGGNFISQALNLLSSVAGQSSDVVTRSLGCNTANGAVRSEVTFRVKNGIIPAQIGFLRLGRIAPDDPSKLDLVFKDQSFMYWDTWRAWKPTDLPANSYPAVERNVEQRIWGTGFGNGAVYLGLMSNSVISNFNSLVGGVLGVIGLPYPFQRSFSDEATLIRAVNQPGRGINLGLGANNMGGQTRTVPGDILQGGYWIDDQRVCIPQNANQVRCTRITGGWWNSGGGSEPIKVTQKRGVRNSANYDDNFPYRSYNCRGNFFQGTTQSGRLESDYANKQNIGRQVFNMGNRACQ